MPHTRLPDALRTRLVDVVGSAHVLLDQDAMAGYLTDWTGRWSGHADAVVRPRDTAEVAAIVALCARDRIPLCIQGGNTGLVGGSVPPTTPPADGPLLLLSTVRMTDIDEVDVLGRCVGVQAGVVIAALDARARDHGLAFGVDLASRESATAGGVVATNAGGIRMIRYGNTRAQVLGIEAVRADGTILRRWHSLVKDNVGYDIPGLLAGSEGTLAVITRVLFGLVSPPANSVVAVVATHRVDDVLGLIGGARSRQLTIDAAEIMTAAGVDLVHEFGIRRPVATAAPYYTLIEVSGAGDVESDVVDLLDQTPGVVDAVVEPGPARALWAAREGHTESVARSSRTPVVKLDVSFPIRELSSAMTDLATVADRLDHPCRPIVFGHVGDGNVHVNLLDVPIEYTDAATDEVFGVVTAHHGSISAEHGIGRAKVRWTHLGRCVIDRATMRAIKDAFDPAGILNPGVIFE